MEGKVRKQAGWRAQQDLRLDEGQSGEAERSGREERI